MIGNLIGFIVWIICCVAVFVIVRKWVKTMTEWHRELAERVCNLENIKFFKQNKPHNYKGKKFQNAKEKQ